MASAATEPTDVVVDGINGDSGRPTDVDHLEVALLDELVNRAATYAERPPSAFDGQQEDRFAGGVRSYFGGDAGAVGRPAVQAGLAGARLLTFGRAGTLFAPQREHGGRGGVLVRVSPP
jgi:hypothetical protein